jgi:hypothetical protein
VSSISHIENEIADNGYGLENDQQFCVEDLDGSENMLAENFEQKVSEKDLV